MRKQTRALVLMVILLFPAGPPPSVLSHPSSPAITGTVYDDQGHPVEGVEVSVHDPKSNQILAQEITNAKGEYTIAELPPGEYHLVLNPRATGFQGQTAVVPIGTETLPVNWQVSATQPAVAFVAFPCPDCPVAWSLCDPCVLGTLGGGALVTGGVGAAIYWALDDDDEGKGESGQVSPSR